MSSAIRYYTRRMLALLTFAANDKVLVDRWEWPLVLTWFPLSGGPVIALYIFDD